MIGSVADGDVMLTLQLSPDGANVVHEKRARLNTLLVTRLRLTGDPAIALIATANGDVRRLNLGSERSEVRHQSNGSFVRNFCVSPSGRYAASSSEHGASAPPTICIRAG
jgi:hypothetical protein